MNTENNKTKLGPGQRDRQEGILWRRHAQRTPPDKNPDGKGAAKAAFGRRGMGSLVVPWT
jgi:hypothetical protein